MEQYNVTGMSCAACSARVEKAVSKVPGVASCSVSLLTNSMGVEGTASSAEIIKAVQDAGYGASPKRAGAAAASSTSADLDALADHETPKLKRRLIASLGFLLVLMYFSMGHMMWGWPLPRWFDGNHIAMGLVQLLLAGIVMVINQKFFINGFKGLLHGSPNMDTHDQPGGGQAPETDRCRRRSGDGSGIGCGTGSGRFAVRGADESGSGVGRGVADGRPGADPGKTGGAAQAGGPARKGGGRRIVAAAEVPRTPFHLFKNNREQPRGVSE